MSTLPPPPPPTGGPSTSPHDAEPSPLSPSASGAGTPPPAAPAGAPVPLPPGQPVSVPGQTTPQPGGGQVDPGAQAAPAASYATTSPQPTAPAAGYVDPTTQQPAPVAPAAPAPAAGYVDPGVQAAPAASYATTSPQPTAPAAGYVDPTAQMAAPLVNPELSASFAVLLRAITSSASLVLRGHLAEAFNLLTAVGRATVAILITLPVMGGMFLATTGSYVASSANGFLSDITHGLFSNVYDFSAGDWIVLFIKGLLVGLVFVLVMLLIMRACFAIQHKPVTFSQLAAVYASSLAPMCVVLPVAFLLFLIPSIGLWSLIMITLMTLHTFTTIFSVIVCYVGMARLGRFANSVAAPYVALLMLGNSLAGVVTFLLVATS